MGYSARSKLMCRTKASKAFVPFSHVWPHEFEALVVLGNQALAQGGTTYFEQAEKPID